MKDLSRSTLHALTPAFGTGGRSEDRGMVNLRDNENPFGGAHRRYPDKLCAALGRRYLDALQVIEGTAERGGDGDTLLLTRGAGDALDLVFRALFEPGRDAIAVAVPGFRLFDELALVHGLPLHRLPRQGECCDRIDVDALCAMPVQGVVLCNPNNPMGTSIQPADIAQLLVRFEGVVLLDEAYVEYTRRPSCRHLVAEHPNLVVVRSMSKALGMAGLRLGAVFAQAQLIAAMRKVRLPFALPRIVAEAAMAELSEPWRLRRQIDRFIAERDRFAAELRRLPVLERVHAEAGFVTVRTDVRLARHLAANGFDTVPCPMGWPRHLRLSVGTPEINERLIAAVSTYTPPENA